MRYLYLIIYFFPFIVQSQKSEFSADNLYRHIEILASDSLEGRKPGTPGDIKAANYIREQFFNSKLLLFGDNGFQKFELVTDVKLGQNNSLSISDKTFELNKDFIPYSFSSSAILETDACFAGYGFSIDEDSLKWNDYEKIDIKGKWVIILIGDPEYDKPKSLFVPYSMERSKIVVAKDYGAAGVLFVNGKNLDEKDELNRLSYDKTVSDAGIPVINISRRLANEILESSGKNIEELEEKLNNDRKEMSFAISAKINAQTDVIQIKSNTQNIVAIKFGTDELLKDEYIVIGAHYDHLGYGGQNSGSRIPDTVAVHYGADDNASGVSALIELAKKFSYTKDVKRSIIFVAFSSEELGLVGSKYFVENKPIENGYISTMINFDMIGRMKSLDPYLSVSGTGTALEFDSILNIYADNRIFKLQKTVDGYGPSDHANFYAADIPVLFVTTGAHQDYHTPYDTKDKINVESMAKVVDYMYEVIIDLANTPSKLHFKQAGSAQSNRSGRKLKVTLGIIPDVASSDIKGLRISGVRKGGPAESGGLKTNDVIIGLNGLEVTNIYDYMQRLSTLKSGETAIVEILRGDEKMVVLIQL
ncbi:MAG: M20/M25/M40 family metallo-hydrolase [Bacteroidota bacterium]